MDNERDGFCLQGFFRPCAQGGVSIYPTVGLALQRLSISPK